MYAGYKQWRMQNFLKGGSIPILCAKRTWKFLKPRPLLIKTMPVFARSDELLALPGNRSVFDLNSAKPSGLLRWATATDFLVLQPERGVPFSYDLAYQQYFLVLDPAQRGVPWNPRNHPKSATAENMKVVKSKGATPYRTMVRLEWYKRPTKCKTIKNVISGVNIALTLIRIYTNSWNRSIVQATMTL